MMNNEYKNVLKNVSVTIVETRSHFVNLSALLPLVGYPTNSTASKKFIIMTFFASLLLTT